MLKTVLRLRALLVTSAVLFGMNTCRADLVISGLYNTGVDDSGNVLPVTTPEMHYALSYESEAGQAYVAAVVWHNPTWQAWVTPPPDSAWIGPDETGSTYPNEPPGNYIYRITFDLTGVDASLAQISGLWATDNSGQIWVNRTYTGWSKSVWGFTQLDPFLLQGVFNSGPNTVEFRVNNESGPTGLLVAGLETTVVPEPATFFAGALLLFPFTVRCVRRLASSGQKA